MMLNHIVILPVVWPLILGALLVLLQKQNIQLARFLSIASTITLVAIACSLLNSVSSGEILVYALGDWPPPFGIILVADRLAAWMLLITSLVSLCALLYAVYGTDAIAPHFHALFQLQLFGLNGAFLTGDLFNLFVFFEILLLASYGLLLHGGGRLRTMAGLHFVIINLAGSTLFLFAVGTLYGLLGTLNMADLAVKTANASQENIALIRSAGLLLFAVFALKAALVPLYLWLPAAYAHTTAPVAALFAIMTKVGVYSILRVYTLIFGGQAGEVANLIDAWLLPLAIATLIAGTLGVLASTHLRQQAAYLVVSSVGTVFIALSINTDASIAAGLYYLPHSTFAAAAFFLLADMIASRRGGINDRFEPGPVMMHHRTIGAFFLLTAVLIAGLPPLSGFIGKFLILQAALSHSAVIWILPTVLITSLLLIVALARSGSMLFYRAQITQTGDDRSYGAVQCSETPAATPGMMIIACLIALCAALLVWAGDITEYTLAAANQLLYSESYIHAVLEIGK